MSSRFPLVANKTVPNYFSDVDIEAQFSINQSRADEITMREEYGSLPMSIHDDGFGDMGFDADEADFIRDDPNIDVSILFVAGYYFVKLLSKCWPFTGKSIGRRYGS